MYFSTTDDVGHEFGPESEETRFAVLEVDELHETPCGRFETSRNR
ncbi:MAG: hypothetical protein IPG58_01040 [Acidobacteria bacterium]|nr:hypothetical protein [Acidobacteriota bacterium]